MRWTFWVDHRSELRSLHQGSIATRSQPGGGKKGRTSRSRKMIRNDDDREKLVRKGKKLNSKKIILGGTNLEFWRGSAPIQPRPLDLVVKHKFVYLTSIVKYWSITLENDNHTGKVVFHG